MLGGGLTHAGEEWRQGTKFLTTEACNVSVSMFLAEGYMSSIYCGKTTNSVFKVGQHAPCSLKL